MDDCVIDYSAIGLSQEEILREIGYRDTLPDDSVLAMINSLLTRLEKEARPRYLYFVSEGEIDGTSVHIQNQRLETGPVITRLLDRSSAFAVFVATAGNEFEQIMQDCKAKGDILENYILDIMGTTIAEKAGDYLERMLEKELTELLHTNRFSPGYCNWHLMEQRKIFGLLGNKPCGIALSDVCLMTTIKSISGIIGIGKHVETRKYACQYCELESCFKRKK
jgi:hypothetical protein